MKNWLVRLDNNRLVKYLLLFALGWVIVQLVNYFASVLVIFVFASICAFLLNYPVSWLQQFIPRQAAVGIVFLLSLLILVGIPFAIGLAMLSQAQQLLNDAPKQINFFIEWFEGIEAFLKQWNLALDFNSIKEHFRGQTIAGLQFGFVNLQKLLGSLFDVIAIAVVTFFMLLDGARLVKLFLKFFPESIQQRLPAAIEQNFLSYFQGRFLLCVLYGVSLIIIFLLLNVPYAFVLAGIIAVLDLIPGIGSIFGTAFVSVIVLPQGWDVSLKVLISCFVLQQVQENLLFPRIMQGSVNLNPVILFLALLVGLKVAGLTGVFLAIPVTGTLVTLFEIEEVKG